MKTMAMQSDERKKKIILFSSIGVVAVCVIWLFVYLFVLSRPLEYKVDSGYATFVEQAKKFLNSGPYSGVEIEQIDGAKTARVFGPVLTRADEEAVKKALNAIQPRPELVFELVPEKK
jgi:hypothetical protein